MREISHSLFLHNNETLSYEFFDYHVLYHNPTIYEVFRVINRTPLFLKAHLDRLFTSVQAGNLHMNTTYNQLLDMIMRLIDMNDIGDMNMKVIVQFEQEVETDIYVYFNVSRYPTVYEYQHGVKLRLYEAVRENPAIKFVRQKLRENTIAYMKESDAFETLLVDTDGNITEGSRTNVFFVKDSALYTAPSDTVLLGITRQATIELAKRRGFQLFEQCIRKAEISDFDSVFITGTSPMLLPVSHIEGISYKVDNFVMRTLMNDYLQMVNNNLSVFSFAKLHASV